MDKSYEFIMQQTSAKIIYLSISFIVLRKKQFDA